MNIKKLLEQSRQSLYHATTLNRAFSILQNDTLEGRTKQKTEHGILVGTSLSREKSFAVNWNGVVFELNWDLLKQNHKIIPVDFLDKSKHFNIKRRYASEEFIMGDIKNIKRYIVNIIFNLDRHDDDFEDLINELDKEGIPYTVL